LLEGTDACVAPVLTLAEAPEHHHMAARKTFIDIDGLRQPAPAPRFSRTVSAVQASVAHKSAASMLEKWRAG
jgi:alpha-methylacyl-CoA racemase